MRRNWIVRRNRSSVVVCCFDVHTQIYWKCIERCRNKNYSTEKYHFYSVYFLLNLWLRRIENALECVDSCVRTICPHPLVVALHAYIIANWTPNDFQNAVDKGVSFAFFRSVFIYGDMRNVQILENEKKNCEMRWRFRLRLKGIDEENEKNADRFGKWSERRQQRILNRNNSISSITQKDEISEHFIDCGVYQLRMNSPRKKIKLKSFMMKYFSSPLRNLFHLVTENDKLKWFSRFFFRLLK